MEEYVDVLDFEHFLKEDTIMCMTTSSTFTHKRFIIIKIRESYEKDITKVSILSALNYNIITNRIKVELRDRALNSVTPN